MKTDEQLRRDVESELQWSPQIDATDIAVSVHQGVVTLTGFVRNYFEKFQAETVAKAVVGVAAVADDLRVRVPAGDGMTDPEIARAAMQALRITLPIGCRNIQAVVRNRAVTLEGVTEGSQERERAESVIRQVKGVVQVTNNLRISSDLAPDMVKQQIEQAFRRRADLDASHVCVSAEGSEVTLSGEVESLEEHDAAVAAARATYGVSNVKDQLTVRR
jgi:osmotically-inducible protein OsmY